MTTGNEKAGATSRAEKVNDSRNPSEAALEKRIFVVLTLSICVAVFLLSIDRTIIAVAIPHITDEFHSYTDVGWYGAGYLITVCAVQPVFGRLFTICDTKWIYISAFAVFEIGSLICAIAPSSAALIAGRAIAGLGAGGVLSGSYVLAAHFVPPKLRPGYIAGVSVLYSIGAIIAPLIGGGLTTNASWRWCFYINLPIGIPVIIAMAIILQPNKTEHNPDQWSITGRLKSLDLPGASLLLGAAVMLFLALQYTAQGYQWSSPLVAGLLTGASATTIVLCAWSLYRGDSALIPPRVLRKRTVIASSVAAVAIYWMLTSLVYYLPIYFQAIRAKSAIGSAVALLPLIVACSLFSLIAGIVVTQTGYFAPPSIIGTAIALIGAGLLTTLNIHTTSRAWIGFQILVGAGLGLAIQQGFTAVQAVLPAADIAIGTSLITFCQSLGGAVGVSVGDTILLETLRGEKTQLAPMIDIEKVIVAGATGFRKIVPDEALTPLLKSYNGSLRKVFIMAAASGGLAFLASCLMEFKRIVKSDEQPGDHEQHERYSFDRSQA